MPLAGSVPSSAVGGRIRHPNPVEVKPREVVLPAKDAVSHRRRGIGEEGVYWGGSRYFYDDGGEPEVKRHKWPIGQGVHPRVAANLAREEQNREANSEILRLRAEKRQLQQERAEFEKERAAFRQAAGGR